MYVRTKGGLGQDNETWSALQPLNRVMVPPVPISYLGNFHEHLGNSPKQTCYTVDNFKPNSWQLTKDIQLSYLDKIAKAIVRTIELKFRKLRLKRKQEASVHLFIEFRGHMDKKTDNRMKPDSETSGRPGHHGLDYLRLQAVHQDLSWRIESELKTQNLHDRFNFYYFMNYSYSTEGSAHSVSSTNPGENRRVEVCILGLRVKKL